MTRFSRISVLGLAVLAASAASVAAQGTTPVPLDKVTLSGAAAKRALTRTEITIEAAEQIAKACVEFARERGGGASVFIVNPSGDIVYAYRSDGQTPNNVDSAYHKAMTSLELRISTRAALNRWNNLEAQLIRTDLNYYLNPGGFPIIVDDQLIGAMGVGGGVPGGDEACGYQALTKVLGPQPPMDQPRPFGGVGNEPPPQPPTQSR